MPNEDWMAEFTDRDDLTLCDITIPVSHDAGLSEAPGCYIPYTTSVGKAQTICQYTDIAGQLTAGSRGFDLRLARDKSGILRTFHGEGLPGGTLGGWGQTANLIFQQINTFLANHTGEIVIVRISHTDESAGAHQAILNYILGDRLLKCGPRDLTSVPLEKIRGKCIAIFDEKALARVDPIEGLHRFSKYNAKNVLLGGLSICGKYAGWTADLSDMSKMAVKCSHEHGVSHTNSSPIGRLDHLFMIYWQIAAMSVTSSVKVFTVAGQYERKEDLEQIDKSKGSHYNLDYILNLHRGQSVSTGKEMLAINPMHQRKFRPNMINLDFINDEIVNKVIEFNEELLPKALEIL